jgi:glycosyltransferase involved in cell wall biosynthesis
VAARVADVFVVRYAGWRAVRVRRRRVADIDVLELPLVAVLPAAIGLALRRRPDVIHAHGMLGATLGAVISVVSRCRLVLEFHDARTDLAPPAGDPLRSTSHRLARALVRRRLAAVVTLSKSQATFAEELRWTGAEPPHVIYPSVDEEFFADPDVLAPLRSDAPVIGYAGNFYPWQGVDLLIRAMPTVWERWPGVRVELWGSYFDAFRETFGELDPRIESKGSAELSEMPAILQSMDILTIPRPDLPANTTTSRKLGEYLASGRPLVVTDVADHRDLVSGNDAGLVVATDSAGVADGILAVLDHPELALHRAGNAITVARRHFSLAEATDRRMQILRRAASRSGSTRVEPGQVVRA